MDPVTFEGYNMVFGAGQEEYRDLPAHRDDDGQVVSCWRLTWRERFRMLWTGRLYLAVLTFHTPMQPQLPSVENPVAPPASPGESA